MDGLAIRDDRTLGRIVATLVALAVLAERAAGRSYPVRCLVLFILRQAESVAGSFVAEAMQTFRPAGLVRIPPVPNSPDDAIGLGEAAASRIAGKPPGETKVPRVPVEEALGHHRRGEE